jgi:hypothetical protein
MPVQFITKDIGSSTANGRVDILSLGAEINAEPAITTGMVGGFSVETDGDDLIMAFKAELSPSEVSALDNVVLNHQGNPSPVETKIQTVKIDGVDTSGGRINTSPFKTSVSRTNFFTHDFTDPTTWYTKSVRFEDHEMVRNTNLGNRFFDIDRGALGIEGDLYLIDVGSAKIFGERQLRDELGRSYAPEVKIDGVVQKEHTLHNRFDWDYEVDYSDSDGTGGSDPTTAGRVQFKSAPPEDSVVTITFCKSTTSEFFIKPAPGKRLKLDTVEIQFASNVAINDTMVFQPYGYLGALPPSDQAQIIAYLVATQQIPPGYTPDPTTIVPYGTPTEYNGMRDFIREANGNYSPIPRSEAPQAFITPRDLRHDAITFPWNYQSVITVSSLAGMYISIRLLHDIPYYGEFGDATFYCYSEDDTPPG